MIRCVICYSKFTETINLDTLFKPQLVCNDCLERLITPTDCCNYCSHPNGYRCCDNSIENESLFLGNQFLKDVFYQVKYLNLVEKIFIFEPFVFNKCQTSYKDFIIVPVPISATMKTKRKFNQSFILATFSKLKVVNCLIRVDNKTQSQKDYLERITNPPVFKLLFLPKQKNILIIDDIYTTGSTLKAIRKLFPCEYNVKFLTIQRTTLFNLDK